MRYSDNSPKKYSKRNHIKNKSNKIYYDDDNLRNKAKKEFKQKKRIIEEDDDDWMNWKENI